MSHSVTIRSQTVTTTTSSGGMMFNMGYMKTWSGILKFLELALGIVCVSIVGNEFRLGVYHRTISELFFLLITTTFMIATFILLISYLTSFATSSIMSKSIYELYYHSIAFILVISAAVTLLVEVNKIGSSREYELMLGATICAFVNSALYLLSAILALRTYRLI